MRLTDTPNTVVCSKGYSCVSSVQVKTMLTSLCKRCSRSMYRFVLRREQKPAVTLVCTDVGRQFPALV